MKTIAAAAVFMMLAASAWADEAENGQANNAANTEEPIVLSEAEMDGVTAGDGILFNYHLFHTAIIDVNASTDTGINRFTFGTEKTFLE